MKQTNLQQRKLGIYGESLSTSFLQKLGYHIIDRNWRFGHGELDIVAIHNQTLVIVEVKTRIGHAYGLPEESVTKSKIRELVRLATLYTQNHSHIPELMRIDVIAIDFEGAEVPPTIRHIKNITG